MERKWALTAIGLLTALGCSGDISTSGQVDEATLPASAISQIEALLAEKDARTPTQRKISSQLLYAASGRFKTGAGTAKAGGGLTSLIPVDSQGRTLIDLKGDVSTASIQSQVQSLGGKVVSTSVAHGSMRVWLSVSKVETLAANSAVQFVRPAMLSTNGHAVSPPGKGKHSVAAALSKISGQVQPLAATTGTKNTGYNVYAGSVLSEGAQAHQADRARKFYNTDGTGVKVGVLSNSDDFKEDAIATGDLPPDTVTVPGQDGRPDDGEGTAMMEVIHDLAPGAQLFFASATITPEAFADNIRTLRFTYHCDVIVDDVIYFFENPYQDDIIAQAVNDVIADGAVYLASAGNNGNENDGTSGTWEGDFFPSGSLTTLGSGYTVHDFGFGNRVISNRIEVGGGPLVLHWSDPGTLDAPQSSNDYDLFVLDPDLRNVIAASTDIQDGTGMPVEFIGFQLPANARVVVAKHPQADFRAIRVMVSKGELGLSTRGSTWGHNCASGAIGTAAVDVTEAVNGVFVAGPTTPVELFSSDGPRRVFYNPDGTRINNGFSTGVTFFSLGGQLRFKPEIAGADGVVTSLPDFTGLTTFFGTSAAAPHVAAIGALIKQAVPGISGAQVRSALLGGALDIEAAGFDRDSGAGVASAMDSLRVAGAKPAVFFELGTITASGTSGPAVLPGTTGQVLVQLSNEGGAGATKVSATVTANTAGVTMVKSTASYPDIAAGASGTNTTAFTFNVPSTAPCGGNLDFTLSVSFTGVGTHPTVIPFSVQTGRAGAPTRFTYSGPVVAIPDGDPFGVDFPVNVTITQGVAKLVLRIDGTTCTSAEGATTVGIDHTYVGDLKVTLTSPSGTIVTLMDRPGGELNDGNNFCQTVLDDAGATSIQLITPVGAPYTGTFQPANPLSAFNGEPAAGAWTLNVADMAFEDTGNVRSFSLDVSTLSCTP
jgi:proprotein convertase P-domain-containing protein/subtilase family protein